MLTISEAGGKTRHLQFDARFVRDDGPDHHIRFTARDVTEKLKKEREQKATEKFRGVLEMAGGVSHRLNQPLTILNNLIDDLAAEVTSGSPGHNMVMMMQQQLTKMNDITRKISNVKKYAAIDYVAGIKIVDIDKAS